MAAANMAVQGRSAAKKEIKKTGPPAATSIAKLQTKAPVPDKVKLVDMGQSGRGSVGSYRQTGVAFQDSRRFQKTLFIHPDSSRGEGEDPARASLLSPLSQQSVIKTVQPVVTLETSSASRGEGGTVAHGLSSQGRPIASGALQEAGIRELIQVDPISAHHRDGSKLSPSGALTLSTAPKARPPRLEGAIVINSLASQPQIH